MPCINRHSDRNKLQRSLHVCFKGRPWYAPCGWGSALSQNIWQHTDLNTASLSYKKVIRTKNFFQVLKKERTVGKRYPPKYIPWKVVPTIAYVQHSVKMEVSHAQLSRCHVWRLKSPLKVGLMSCAKYEESLPYKKLLTRTNYVWKLPYS